MTPQKPADRPATLSDTDARILAIDLLTHAPAGALTLINGHIIEHIGGWPALGRALTAVTTELELDLLECSFGNGRHELSTHLTGDYIAGTVDWDDDLHVPETTVNSCGAHVVNEPDDLPAQLAPFGSNSIPALARLLARENDMSGVLPVLLTNTIFARPYDAILQRQHLIADPVVRAGAVAATYGWLAVDLADFAAARTHAPTIVASDDRESEWEHLAHHATLSSSLCSPSTLLTLLPKL